MIVDRQENTTLITQECVEFNKFVNRFSEAYSKYKKDNIILNLMALTDLKANDLMEFHEIVVEHLGNSKSFVIVTDSVNYNDVNGDLVVVPTLKEAYDLIEMEEIERDLDA
ncbi:ribonuclease Z [Robertkochia solimangrovi]|uniref:ribonuclease Z n=1 Tax=Robertkochia solimangrovi TaxID=2213046 RepID=UPI001180C840|nr:ribonuclease Z [Robertkochia solimangrovi]TRZ42876.1 ribonuclease Z [Robertkochia solimangrovi]